MLQVATSCSGQVQQPERPLPTFSRPVQPLAVSAKTFSDRAATSYGSEGWGFESLRARQRSHRSGPCNRVAGPEFTKRAGSTIRALISRPGRARSRPDNLGQ